MAETLAKGVIQVNTDFDGRERSLLLMVSRDLTKVLKSQYPTEPQTLEYLEQLTLLSA